MKMIRCGWVAMEIMGTHLWKAIIHIKKRHKITTMSKTKKNSANNSVRE